MQSEEWDTIPIPPLERLVNVAQNSFDFVLADLGSQFSSEWSPMLRMAKHDPRGGGGQCAGAVDARTTT